MGVLYINFVHGYEQPNLLTKLGVMTLEKKEGLKKANALIKKIAAKNKNISPITTDDFDLFNKFFAKEKHTYGNSWTYITQGMYGLGDNNLGYKYYDGKNLSALSIYPKVDDPDTVVIYWIRPMGKGILDKIAELSKSWFKEYSVPTYVKKLFKVQYDYLKKKGLKDVDGFPWHESAPMEDDTFPEVIIDVENTLDKAKSIGKRKRLGRTAQYFRHFSNDPNVEIKSIFKLPDEAWSLTEDFFSQDIKSLMLNISDPYDYWNVIHTPSKLLSEMNLINELILKEGRYIGYYISVQQDSEYYSLYATISLRNSDSTSVADYMIMSLIDKIKSSNAKYLNLGGSEQNTLNHFKEKFDPVETLKMYWAALY